MAVMKEEYVTVSAVPTHVMSWGGWIEDFKDERLVLCIPGNPGLTGYYTKFLEALYSNLKIPVWVMSHAGHELPSNVESMPSLNLNPQLYDLQGQIQHKIDFIEKYVPKSTKIYFIGHSIGCQIILNILKNTDIHSQVEKCYLLFPTIEHMSTTVNGKFLINILYIVPLIAVLSRVFCVFPNGFQRFLLNAYSIIHKPKISAELQDTTIQLINPMILRNVFHFANDEMLKVKELDSETVKRFGDKLLLYYGKTDNWCPVDYYANMKALHPDVKSVLCTKGFEHAFVLKSSKEVAEMVTQWIQEDVKEPK